jgi:DNA polymerase-3 subunit delta
MDAAAQKVLKDIKARKFEPVYLLQGEETFYIDLLSNAIEQHALGEQEREFNQVIVYGRDTPVSVILTHARRFPMMAERQVVIVREAQDIPDLQKDGGAKLLLDYFSKPVPSTVLVLCHKSKTLDKRKELGKKAEQLVLALTFKKPADTQLPAFVNDYAKDKDCVFDEKAVMLLCEYVGNDLNRLANEIDKVVMGAQKGVPVSAESVMSQVGISREYNIFELQKALILKDSLRVAKIVQYFEANTKKNPVIPLVAFLFSFFSKLLVASATPDRSERALVAALKISPYAAKDYVAALQRYSSGQLQANISWLKQADLKLKGVNSGLEDEGQILKELVFRLMM